MRLSSSYLLPPDQKRSLCSSLTGVVKASPLKGAIDPKQFFMMVNANFATIYRDDKLDLAPLWDSLSGQHQAESLFALFLKFDEVARAQGIETLLPKAVDALAPEARAQYLQSFPPLGSKAPSVPPTSNPPPAQSSTPAPAPASTPAPGLFSETAEGLFSEPAPGPSSARPPTPSSAPAASAAPKVTDETKQRITWALVQALKATPAGILLNSGQIQYMVTARFDEFCDGKTFDVNPVFRSLLEVPGINEEDIFVGILRFGSVLHNAGLEMTDPQTNLDPETQERLLAEARSHAGSDAFRAGGRGAGSIPPPSPLPTPRSGKGAGETKADRQLRKFGLRRSVDKDGKTRTSPVRVIIMLVFLVLCGLAAYYYQPRRRLDPEQYQAILPVREILLVQGTFAGYLDDPKWDALSDDKRQTAVKGLEDLLRQQGYLRDVAIVNGTGFMVIFDVKGKKLAVAEVPMSKRLMPKE